MAQLELLAGPARARARCPRRATVTLCSADTVPPTVATFSRDTSGELPVRGVVAVSRPAEADAQPVRPGLLQRQLLVALAGT